MSDYTKCPLCGGSVSQEWKGENCDYCDQGVNIYIWRIKREMLKIRRARR